MAHEVVFPFESGIDDWIEAEILWWGQHHLPDIVAKFEDGVAEKLIDEEYANMIEDFPRQQLFRQIHALEARQRNKAQERSNLFPHRLAKRGIANAVEWALHVARVPSLFEEQAELLAQVARCKWLDLLQTVPMPMYMQPGDQPFYIIAHLFSGRRRPGDIHERLHYWAQQFGVRVLVLSLDIANSQEFGNLHHTSTTWSQLLKLYREGKIQPDFTGFAMKMDKSCPSNHAHRVTSAVCLDVPS